MKGLKTLRVRFSLWTAGLLLAGLVIFGLFVYANMSYSLSAAVDETLRVVTAQLLAEVEVRRGELISVEHSIDDPQYEELREQGLSILVWNQNGDLVQQYGPYSDLPPPRLDMSASNSMGEFSTATEPTTKDQIRIFDSQVFADNQVVGTLQVAQNLKNVRRVLDRLSIALLIGGPLVVMMAGVGGYFLAARALAPIDKITGTARQISAQDLSARLSLPETDDEVGRLAATFDSMLTRLDDAFRRERQFTADASHELRTPLAAMQTIIASTLTRRRDVTEYEQALSDLGQEAEHMTLLTQGLLQLARQDSALQPARLERIDLAILLKDVLASLAPLAEDRGLRLVDRLPDDDLIMMGDSDGLIRLFVNLIENAIKYTTKGTIEISALPPTNTHESMAITVRDTGVGIAPEHLPHIFDRFYRIDKSRSTNGTGLGLAIAKNIARAHGGDIAVQSKVGEGTTFTVQLSTRGKTG